jgi:hypothetical protein
MSEWTPYRIQIPRESAPSSRDGQLLETVYHVVHVPLARRILEDGHLTDDLTFQRFAAALRGHAVTFLGSQKK